MGKMLTLLSGKGGSGKTTLALSMASLMSKCGIKVLLVDCDMSTNGATYFYENKLLENKCNIITFFDLLHNSGDKNELLNINENMYFMPSVIKITKKNTETYIYNRNDAEKIKVKINDYARSFDVVIFDCQAGYTDILKLILPLADYNLVVIEADAISSAAIRSLYLKIGDIINDRKIYQVFNKASDEEYEIYSKLSGGTVFTNLETIRFDWRIRKAFSVAEIPDMENTSANYGEQVYNVCRLLFKGDTIQDRLKRHGLIIAINKELEEKNRIEQKIDLLKEENEKSKNKIYKTGVSIIAVAFGSLALAIFAKMVNGKVLADESESGYYMMLILLAVFLVIMALSVLLIDIFRERTRQYKQFKMWNMKLEDITKSGKENQKVVRYRDEGMPK